MHISKIGYVIPEFPGQTHSWMWREISQLRQWGVPIRLISTRRPDIATRARHAFADPAEQETFYLWPAKPFAAITALAWAMFFHPIGFLKAVVLGCTLPVDRRPVFRSVLPLLIPACLLARECSRARLSHLHSQSCSNSAILCMMVKRLIGLRFSMTINANIDWWGGAMKEKFHDAEFTNSHARWLLDQMRHDYPTLRNEQTLLARIGVDTQRWKPASDKPRPTTNQPRLLTVGRLTASKGHDDVLRAVRLLIDDGLNVSLRLAGSGPEEGSLKKLATELNLADHVIFLGSVSEDRLITELRSTDVFMLASHAEPLGVVYMEAMSMGVATIGTRAGGVGEIITDGVDGLLIQPNEPAQLAEAARRLLCDEALRVRLAVAGRARIVREFDSRLGAKELYRRLFGSVPPGET